MAPEAPSPAACEGRQSALLKASRMHAQQLTGIQCFILQRQPMQPCRLVYSQIVFRRSWLLSTKTWDSKRLLLRRFSLAVQPGCSREHCQVSASFQAAYSKLSTADLTHGIEGPPKCEQFGLHSALFKASKLHALRQAAIQHLTTLCSLTSRFNPGRSSSAELLGPSADQGSQCNLPAGWLIVMSLVGSSASTQPKAYAKRGRLFVLDFGVVSATVLMSKSSGAH